MNSNLITHYLKLEQRNIYLIVGCRDLQLRFHTRLILIRSKMFNIFYNLFLSSFAVGYSRRLNLLFMLFTI